MKCQIVLDSWHGRGWTDSYLLRVDGRVAGYGLVEAVRAERKETITEFSLIVLTFVWQYFGSLGENHTTAAPSQSGLTPAVIGLF